ncbi:MAG TPA: hypothetical protein VHB98_14600 [Chloroflexota bacterium]|jgi:hypothetical protein|nr:hypothetical protein [Chloroflexota bacterium]
MVGEHIARRRHRLKELARDPYFLGYPLARYQQDHQLTTSALARLLGIDAGRLDELRLCPRPWPDPYQIRLSRIADAFGVDTHVLAQVMAAADQPGGSP